MITTALLLQLLIIVYAVLGGLLLLPDVSINSDFVSALGTFGSHLQGLDGYFPVSAFLTIVSLVVAIEGSVIVWGLINWALRRIPTQS